MIILQYAAAVVVGYLLGSIPVGYLIAKRTTKKDLTKWGSGKIGGTNVLRTAGKKVALRRIRVRCITGSGTGWSGINGRA